MMNLGKDIEKTGYYQSVLKQTKLKVVPKFLEKGFSIQEIAESLELDVEEVKKVAEELVSNAFRNLLRKTAPLPLENWRSF